jgi:hypothetical protein
MPDKQSKDTVKNIISAALCDFIAYLGAIDTPIIVGGQYKDAKLITHFNIWLNGRKFDIADASKGADYWLTMCLQGLFAGSKNFDTEPEIESEIEPRDNAPESGYFDEDDWKPTEDKKGPWHKRGENWKKGKDDEDLSPA